MPCQKLIEGQCADNSPCNPWLEWESTAPDHDSDYFCKRQLDTPLTAPQSEELRHIIFNALTAITINFELISGDETKDARETHIARGLAAVDRLKEHLGVVGI